MDKGDREVKAMRKDWQYANREFWTVVQWTDEGLAYVIVNRAPADNHKARTLDTEEVKTIKSSSCRPEQIPDVIESTEQRAKTDLDGIADGVFQILEGLGFETADSKPIPEFEAFYSHNDACESAGGFPK